MAIKKWDIQAENRRIRLRRAAKICAEKIIPADRITALLEQVIEPGDRVCDEVRRLCGLDSIVIPFGIDVEKFKPQKLERDDTPFTFVMAKPLEAWYGIDLAIRALNQCSSSARLVIAGGGPEEGRLKSLAESLGIEKRIDFLGQVNHEEIPNILNAADCFLNLSRRESFGVVILEAMACGLPVIASMTHGAEELIESGVDGMLVPIDGLAETADAMKLVIQNQPRRESIAKQGLAKVREQFHWDGCVRQMVELYNDVTA